MKIANSFYKERNGKKAISVFGFFSLSRFNFITIFLFSFFLIFSCNSKSATDNTAIGINTPETNPPSAPENVIVSIGDTQLIITWDTVSGADSYSLYWSNTTGAGKSGTKITSVAPGYIHSGLTNDTEYFYVVTAVNTNGESDPSIEVSNTPVLIKVASLTFDDENLETFINNTETTYINEITSFDGNNQDISDISGLEALTNLTDLKLYSNSITDLSPLSFLTNLTDLDLGSNTIMDISSLSSLTNLTDLYLDGNSISDVSALSDLTSLTNLYLDGNNIVNLNPLSGLTNLKILDLGANGIANINPLSGLTGLTTLFLDDNNISDISPLSGLTNLTALYLAQNSITDVSPLSGLTNLTILYIMNNSITTGVASLTTLTKATIINLSANSTIPCGDSTILDDTLDSGGNGMETGIVQWDSCSP